MMKIKTMRMVMVLVAMMLMPLVTSNVALAEDKYEPGGTSSLKATCDQLGDQIEDLNDMLDDPERSDSERQELQGDLNDAKELWGHALCDIFDPGDTGGGNTGGGDSGGKGGGSNCHWYNILWCWWDAPAYEGDQTTDQENGGVAQPIETKDGR